MIERMLTADGKMPCGGTAPSKLVRWVPAAQIDADISRAERLVAEAAKMYRLDEPSPTTMQAYLDEAAQILGNIARPL